MNKIKKFGLIGLLSALPILGFSQKDSTDLKMRVGITGKQLNIKDGDLLGWSTAWQIDFGKYQSVDFQTSFLKNRYSFGDRASITNIDVQLCANYSTNKEKKIFGVFGPGIEYSDIIGVSLDGGEGKRTCEVAPILKLGTGIRLSKEKTLYLYFKRNLNNGINQGSIEFGF